MLSRTMMPNRRIFLTMAAVCALSATGLPGAAKAGGAAEEFAFATMSEIGRAHV